MSHPRERPCRPRRPMPHQAARHDRRGRGDPRLRRDVHHRADAERAGRRVLQRLHYQGARRDRPDAPRQDGLSHRRRDLDRDARHDARGGPPAARGAHGQGVRPRLRPCLQPRVHRARLDHPRLPQRRHGADRRVRPAYGRRARADLQARVRQLAAHRPDELDQRRDHEAEPELLRDDENQLRQHDLAALRADGRRRRACGDRSDRPRLTRRRQVPAAGSRLRRAMLPARQRRVHQVRRRPRHGSEALEGRRRGQQRPGRARREQGQERGGARLARRRARTKLQARLARDRGVAARRDRSPARAGRLSRAGLRPASP